MNYNQPALKRLLRRIGMDKPLGYLIEGKGAERVYRSLGRRSKEGTGRVIDRGDYSVVADVLSDIVNSQKFRFKKKKYETYQWQPFVSVIESEIFTPSDIENFKRFYGIGFGERTTYDNLSGKSTFARRQYKNKRKLMDKAVKILKDKYRSKIWERVHEELGGRNLS